ncbi:hypothetical protein Dalk_4537 [Desulfatibacillum aliphaticivorans]|uniref:Uncharacterized protein n=1 Tax=Desulfatibacillum aliphaticivorans TaxID=218208 RepID=B8FCQ2_DESAL|nr:hypothetical protein [Desulfatibacillum aliphaticivorans]ACL06215.1 hypothetical protein Dalk_4537 [Desulfatibacillum aliphaticivorans]
MKWVDAKTKPSEGQEVVVRARAGVGEHWSYQIGIWSDGVFKNPYMGCDMCGGDARYLPVTWNPFSRPVFEWLPLSKFIEMERKIDHLEFEKARLHDRVLKCEEVMYEAVVKGNDNDLIDYVNEGLEKI